jgi:tetratricopeptide (TPR) repeat protein
MTNMWQLRRVGTWCLTVVLFLTGAQHAWAQTGNLVPKYGRQVGTSGHVLTERDLLARMDTPVQGEVNTAADMLADRGWQAWRRGDVDTAMRRFNQAWLLLPNHGGALWGMAVIEMGRKNTDSGWSLFQEAAPMLMHDVDFVSDYARTQSMMGVLKADAAMLAQADSLFAKVLARAPEHTLNLQNWAIALFYREEYAGAWAKLMLAEETPRAKALDPQFIADLSAKMPRPSR